MAADHTPQRVVSLQPSATAILAAVDKLDRLVACTKYCVDLYPAIANRGVALVKDSWTATTGEILATNPDLVIAAVPYQEKTVSEILKAGVRFLGLAPRNLNDIYTDIATIAGLVGASDPGQSMIARMKQEIKETRRKATKRNRRRVFCEEWGKPLIASQRWVAELVEAAGGEFVVTPGKQVSPEEVRSADPDVLIAAWCGAGDRVPLEKIVRDRGWTEMSAVKQQRVYCIRDEFLNTPAPALMQGLRALASAIHPEDFPQAAGLRCINRGPVQAGHITD